MSKKQNILDKKLNIYIDRPYKLYVNDIIDGLCELSESDTTKLILAIVEDKSENVKYLRKLMKTIDFLIKDADSKN